MHWQENGHTLAQDCLICSDFIPSDTADGSQASQETVSKVREIFEPGSERLWLCPTFDTVGKPLCPTKFKLVLCTRTFKGSTIKGFTNSVTFGTGGEVKNDAHAERECIGGQA